MKWLPSLRRETSETETPNAATGSSENVDFVFTPEPAKTAPSSPPPNTPLDDAADGNGAEHSRPDETPAILPATQLSPVSVDPLGADSHRDMPEENGEWATWLTELRGEIVQRQQTLSDDQRSLGEMFATRLRSDEAQARAVEKLHDELRQYKANFVRQQLLPLLKEVIFCHDFVVGQMPDPEAAGAVDAPAPRALDATRQMLIDLLFKYDVEPYQSEGELFDPKTQQCTKVVPVGRADADKTIAARGLPGFRSAEGIVRREMVSVYKFTPGAD